MLSEMLRLGLLPSLLEAAEHILPRNRHPLNLGIGQDMKAMMQDTIRSSLTEYGVIPKASPTQSQSIAVDTETTGVIDLSEGKLSDSEQEGPDSETPELDQLLLTAEEQMDYDSFALASPVQQGLLYGSLLRRLHLALSFLPQA